MKIVSIAIFPLGIGMCIYFIDQRVHIPLLIRGYIPDALWASAFTNSWLLTYSEGNRKIHSLLICVLVIFGVEVSQLFPFLPGTFDMLDIIVMFLSSLLSFFLFHNSNPFTNQNHFT